MLAKQFKVYYKGKLIRVVKPRELKKLINSHAKYRIVPVR